jgi:hypothetical protein
MAKANAPRKAPVPIDPIDVPPGATRKAQDRPLDPGGGVPGSGAGPRHAAGDPGSNIETTGRVDANDDESPLGAPEAGEPLAKPPPGARLSGSVIRLTGFEAIEFAEKEGLKLNKHPDRITGPRTSLSIAEAKAIASEDASLIWLDVAEDEYYGPRTNLEPER